MTILSAPIIISVTFTFMLHSYLFLARSRYLSFFSLSFSFTRRSAGTAMSTIPQVIYFFFLLLLTIIGSGCLAEMFVSQNHKDFSRLIFLDGIWVVHTQFAWSDFNFLHIFWWITLPTKSWQVLYSVCVNLFHLLTMQLIISCLSTHNLHLFICYLLHHY